MAPQLDSTTRDALLARMRFYRDLGLTEFYRRPVDPALFASVADELAQDDPAEVQSESHNQKIVAPGLASSTWDTTSQPETLYEEQTIPARKSFPAPPQVADAIAPAEREAALRLIREDIGDCTRCALHKGRNKLVFADGSAEARLMFVGEGPGADEDAQGLPFVGRAGQLLNNMIVAMGLKREEVYIANIVKCRPPGNRAPEFVEATTCSQFLLKQIDIVHPQVIVALGATAATYLLGVKQSLASLRGQWHTARGAKVAVTYHPAFLLRDPRQKGEAWKDLQRVMAEMGLTPPPRNS